MPRFFLPAAQVSGDRARITGDDAAHLARSLRATPGERLVVVDDAGREHGVRLLAVDPACVEAAVEWSRDATGDPLLRVHVVQALPKDGMDELVEALAEVGVAAVWPVISERTVARPDARRAAHRVERWRSIARSAAGLAGRAAAPEMHEVMPLQPALAQLPRGTRLLACTVTGASAPLARLTPPPQPAESIAVAIGPEGGWSGGEIVALQAAGAALVHLGGRVLRARLAGVVAAAVLLAAAGDMDAAAAGWPAGEAVTR
jgi:16S rRNA (uracil1498-N3)-methyltransferase